MSDQSADHLIDLVHPLVGISRGTIIEIPKLLGDLNLRVQFTERTLSHM